MPASSASRANVGVCFAMCAINLVRLTNHYSQLPLCSLHPLTYAVRSLVSAGVNTHFTEDGRSLLLLHNVSDNVTRHFITKMEKYERSRFGPQPPPDPCHSLRSSCHSPRLVRAGANCRGSNEDAYRMGFTDCRRWSEDHQ